MGTAIATGIDDEPDRLAAIGEVVAAVENAHGALCFCVECLPYPKPNEDDDGA